jgi:hypothetical protein
MGSNGKSAEVSAAIVGGKGDIRRYSMYEVAAIDATGAFLRGQLLFECEETFELELKFADGSTMRLSAQVSETVLEEEPGIWVSFGQASDNERDKLKKKLGTVTIWG